MKKLLNWVWDGITNFVAEIVANWEHENED